MQTSELPRKMAEHTHDPAVSWPCLIKKFLSLHAPANSDHDVVL